MKNKENKLIFFKRYLLFAVLILLTYFFEQTINLLTLERFLRQFLLLPLLCAIAMHEKPLPATIFGAVIGILIDTKSQSTDGFFALTLACVAFLVSILLNRVFRKNIKTAILLSVFFCVFVLSLHWLFFVFFAGCSFPIYIYLKYYLLSAALSACWMILFYYLTKKIYEGTRPVLTGFFEVRNERR